MVENPSTPLRASRSLGTVFDEMLHQRLREFALAKHGSQTYNDQPYIVHLDQVAALARKYGLGRKYELAAILHDVLEDTDTTYEELVQVAGREVAAMVFNVTGEGKNRAERRASIIRKLLAHPEDVDLKLLDRIANVSAALEDGKTKFVEMYRGEMPDYEPVFSQGTPELYAKLRELLSV